jgi:hypothetical protein
MSKELGRRENGKKGNRVDRKKEKGSKWMKCMYEIHHKDAIWQLDESAYG